MYCPNCKQNFEGKFCPECGTKLIEESYTGSMNINLGDANAINGGIHISHNITERSKTNEELFLERKNRYRSLCRQYLSDGKIDETERIMLDNLARELDLDKETQKEILSSEMESVNTRNKGLDKSGKVVFMQISKKIKSFDLQGIITLYPKLQNLERNFNDAPVKFYYYLLTSVLCPSECIRRFESHHKDNYWLTYWSVISYLLKGDNNKAEKAKSLLANWVEYSEENSILLDIAISIKNNDIETAEAYREVLDGEYSEELSDFAISMFSILNNINDLSSIEQNPQQAFYLNGLFFKELGINSLGILQPDGTLSQEYSSCKVSSTDFAIINKTSTMEENKEEDKKAMKDIVAKPFSIEEFNNLADTDGFNYLEIEDGWAIFSTKNEKGEKVFGLWNRKQEELLLKQANDLYYEGHGIYTYSIGQNYGIISVKTKECTIEENYEGTLLINEDLISVYKKDKKGNDLWGIIDIAESSFALMPEYTKITEYKFNADHLFIEDTNGMVGLFNCKEKKIVGNRLYKKIIRDDANRYFFMITNLANVDKDFDVYVPGAKALFQKITGGIQGHPLFENIIYILKTKEGPYTICNTNYPYNSIEWFDFINPDWYDDKVDEEYISPLIIVAKNDKIGLMDAENGNLVLLLEFEEVNADGIEGSPCVVFSKDGIQYTFNMFTRQFE